MQQLGTVNFGTFWIQFWSGRGRYGMPAATPAVWPTCVPLFMLCLVCERYPAHRDASPLQRTISSCMYTYTSAMMSATAHEYVHHAFANNIKRTCTDVQR